MILLQTDRKDCEICKDLLPLVKDGVASASSREFVLSHIAHCADCRAEFDAEPSPPLESAEALRDEKTVRRVKRAVWLGTAAVLALGVYLGIDISTAGSRLVFLLPCAAFVLLSVLRGRENPKRMLWVLGMTVGVIAAYYFFSHVELFAYDVGAWAAKNATFFLALLCTSTAYFGKHRLALLSFAGHCLGILAGGRFGQLSFDPGGGLLHNGWQIYLIVLLGGIVLGGALELLLILKKRRAASQKAAAQTLRQI